jgi:hypothetical protein
MSPINLVVWWLKTVIGWEQPSIVVVVMVVVAELTANTKAVAA